MMARYGRRSGGGTVRASRWMPLRYSGTCKVCGDTVAAGATGFYDGVAKTITCSGMECARADGLVEQVWHGSPVSGGYVDALRAFRVGDPAPVSYQNHRSHARTIVLSSGAVLSVNSRGRCEDAPCCGCCT